MKEELKDLYKEQEYLEKQLGIKPKDRTTRIGEAFLIGLEKAMDGHTPGDFHREIILPKYGEYYPLTS